MSDDIRHNMLDDIQQQLTYLRAQRYKHPTLIRMHPLDIQWVQKKYGLKKKGLPIEGNIIYGIPVVPDDALERGKPKAEYEEDAK